MMDTKVGVDEKMDPAEVEKSGFETMLNGDVVGLKNKSQMAAAHGDAFVHARGAASEDSGTWNAHGASKTSARCRPPRVTGPERECGVRVATAADLGRQSNSSGTQPREP